MSERGECECLAVVQLSVSGGGSYGCRLRPVVSPFQFLASMIYHSSEACFFFLAVRRGDARRATCCFYLLPKRNANKAK